MEMTQLHRLDSRTRAPRPARGRAVLIALLLSLVPAAPAAAQRWRDTTDAGPAERALFRIEAEWSRAVIARDAAAIRRIVAPQWVYSDESGLLSREEGIKAFTAGADTVVESGNEQMRAIVYGNTAVVTGILWMRGRGPSGPFLNRYRYTDTWLRMNGRWRCIAAQDYLMPKEP
jgi:ketosteroid isomerase-like protein